ncbi:hypothetical protein H6G97_43880 [Nostoc flagelliforme FACHB-838]|uniref:Uncharacterized protein n=2 Tax=Nostoc flagelliforme TaxID=1306274 RepID=A0ABR8E3C6_9NOSO|nr:hypothetical protein [Nostoc flagelliforme FACHB-838]
MNQSIEHNAVTVVIREDIHENFSRTFFSRNTPDLIKEDAQNLSLAFKNDADAILGKLQNNELTPEVVGAYMRAYRENVAKRVFAYNPDIDNILMGYLRQARSNQAKLTEMFERQLVDYIGKLKTNNELTTNNVNKLFDFYTKNVKEGKITRSDDVVNVLRQAHQAAT